MKNLFRNIFLVSCLLLIAGTVEAQAQSVAKEPTQTINTDVTNTATPVQTTAKGEPQGNTLEARIAKAEFYKAPTADVPVHYAVPELTGNAEQDAEIQQVRSRDYETFQSYEAKANEILQAFPSIAAREYLYSVGMPRLTYTGNAYADWQTFKAAFKTWQKVNSEYLSLFEQRATEINRQSPAPQSK